MSGFMLKEGNGAQIVFHGTKMTVKVYGDESEGRYSLIEMVHPPNVGPALHIHPTAPEAYYVLEGEYFVTYGGNTHKAIKGDFVFVPKGISHKYKSGLNGGKLLVISPAGLERYFEKVADALVIGPVSWELEKEIANRFGQEFLENLQHWGQ